MLSNKIFDELSIGDSASLKKTLEKSDIELFGLMSGDFNPAHFDNDFAEKSQFKGVIAHGMWSSSFISTLLGTQLPGPGTIYLSQQVSFKRPVRIGDEIDVKVIVKSLDSDRKIVELENIITNQHGKVVVEGLSKVLAPSEKIEVEEVKLPELNWRRDHDH